LAGNVADGCGELRDEIQVVKLAWRALVPLLVEGEGERFVVREDGEMPGLQHVTEVPHGLIDRQELPVRNLAFPRNVGVDRRSWEGDRLEGL